jgi:hypothetical protein
MIRDLFPLLSHESKEVTNEFEVFAMGDSPVYRSLPASVRSITLLDHEAATFLGNLHSLAEKTIDHPGLQFGPEVSINRNQLKAEEFLEKSAPIFSEFRARLNALDSSRASLNVVQNNQVAELILWSLHQDIRLDIIKSKGDLQVTKEEGGLFFNPEKRFEFLLEGEPIHHIQEGWQRFTIPVPLLG